MSSLPIRILSDLHCEFAMQQMTDHLDYCIPKMPGDEDTVLILAGDVCNYARSASFIPIMTRVRKQFRAVIIIAGNHEYYHGSFLDATDFKEFIAPHSNIHFLEGTAVEIDDVAFIGATLWTDFDKDSDDAKLVSEQFMNDYPYIEGVDGAWLTSKAVYEAHQRDLTAIKSLMREYREKGGFKRVVVTHHGCTLKSIHPKYKTAGLSNFSFTSNLLNLVNAEQPVVWIHGHTHESLRYKVGATDVIVNPAGYRHRWANAYENFNFDPELKLYI
jgi:predicted phosphohydrolase